MKSRNKPIAHNLQLRQCIHIRIMRETHAAVKMMSCKYGLSIQEIIDGMCRLLVEGEPFIERMLENMVESKKQRVYTQLLSTDAETLFDAIEINSPLSNSKKK